MSYASDALIDAQEREIEKLQADNAKLHNNAELLREMQRHEHVRVQCYMSENVKLRDENTRLRERLRKVWNAARLLQANGQIEGMRITDEFRAECEADFAELGVDE